MKSDAKSSNKKSEENSKARARKRRYSPRTIAHLEACTMLAKLIAQGMTKAELRSLLRGEREASESVS